MFSVKQFIIHQEHCAMKVGTDGVLLGAWFELYNIFLAPASSKGTLAKLRPRILDIGTGTGLLALMASQRFPSARITALELDQEACQQAKENIDASVFSSSIEVIQGSLQDYSAEKTCKTPLFQSIICNPPYFSLSLKSPDQQRTKARHTDTLPFSSLIAKAYALLDKEGTFSLILPALEFERFTKEIIAFNAQLDPTFYPYVLSRLCRIHPRVNGPIKRVLFTYTKTSKQHLKPQETSLEIEVSRHTYTDDYQNLTKDFYLKM